MANTYSQIHLQFVFAPKFRAGLIKPSWEHDLYKYITGTIQKNNHKMLCLNGMPDHVHMLIGFHTTQSIADCMQDVKAYSSKWINDHRLTSSKFEWQSGYGAFSYSKSQIPDLINYIKNQKEHHKKRTFIKEYTLFLKKFEIDFEEAYIFKDPE